MKLWHYATPHVITFLLLLHTLKLGQNLAKDRRLRMCYCGVLCGHLSIRFVSLPREFAIRLLRIDDFATFADEMETEVGAVFGDEE